MSIVKAAFIEGRETEVEWDESKSKQAEVKLQVALDNISRMNEREYNTLIPLQQICPNTGKILNTFPSRLAAAKWVVANVLKRPDKNPLSITGNIEMCMRAGWKSYGYFWKICKLQDAIKTTGNTSGQQVFVRKIGKDAVFPSIAEAAAFVGVNRKTLSVKLKNDAFYVSKGYLCQFYNSQKKQLNFASVNRASIETGIGEHLIRKLILQKKPLNNYYITTSKNCKARYKVFKGGRSVGTYASLDKAAEIVGVSRTTLSRYMLKGELIGTLKYRVEKV